MQAPGGPADQGLQARLDIHVNVLERAVEGKVSRLDLRLDPVEPLQDRRRVVV